MRTSLIQKMSLAVLLAHGFAGETWRCQATDYSWNVGSGDWSDATKWSPNGVPAATDTATIGSGTVSVSTDTTVNNLNLTGGTIVGTAVLSVVNNFTWTAGGMTGSG